MQKGRQVKRRQGEDWENDGGWKVKEKGKSKQTPATNIWIYLVGYVTV